MEQLMLELDGKQLRALIQGANEQGIGRQLDEAFGFRPLGLSLLRLGRPKTARERALDEPFPVRALRGGPGEAPLIEGWR